MWEQCSPRVAGPSMRQGMNGHAPPPIPPTHPCCTHVGCQGHASVDGGVGLGGGVHALGAVVGGQVCANLAATLRAVELGVEEGNHEGVVGVAGGAEALGALQRRHVANVGRHPAAAGMGGWLGRVRKGLGCQMPMMSTTHRSGRQWRVGRWWACKRSQAHAAPCTSYTFTDRRPSPVQGDPAGAGHAGRAEEQQGDGCAHGGGRLQLRAGGGAVGRLTGAVQVG